MTLDCSKDVKTFEKINLDVDEILRGGKLKLGFIFFHIFDVNALTMQKEEKLGIDDAL